MLERQKSLVNVKSASSTQRYALFWWNDLAEAGYAGCGDKNRYKTCKTASINKKEWLFAEQPMRMTSSRWFVMVDGAVMRRL
jgi:hypothetical protein